MVSLPMCMLLFVASVVAQTTQFTTSLWLTKDFSGATKIGYYGSVINANSSHTTLELSYDNGTDFEALAAWSDLRLTVTVNPTYVEFGGDITAESMAARLKCEQSATSITSNATCTIFYGAGIADEYFCPTTTEFDATSVRTRTYMYSGRGSEPGGVETILRTIYYNTYSLNTETEFSAPPSFTSASTGWCTNKSMIGNDYASVFAMPQKQFIYYPVVITAGAEKLPATQGASVSPSLPAETGNAASGGLAQHQGITAAFVAVAAPAVVGLAVGAAAVLL